MGQRAKIFTMSLARPTSVNSKQSECSTLAGLVFGSRRRHAVESSLQELEGLSLTAGATVVLRCVQERSQPDPARFLGRGKVKTLAAACEAEAVDLVIFDDELTPGQVRNLEAVLGCRVVDRTQSILDIFASRARTREGRLQVELAQLRYLLPRLTGGGLALSFGCRYRYTLAWGDKVGDRSSTDPLTHHEAWT
jgi:GTP-binding protein HflX